MNKLQEQLRSGIEGSDVGAILGLEPGKTAYQVWIEKTGKAEPWGEDRRNPIGQGLRTLIFDKSVEYLNQGYGGEFSINESEELLRAEKHDFMTAYLDGILVHSVQGAGVLEIKTAKSNEISQWENNSLPGVYFAQMQHYLEVTQLPYGIILCLLADDLINFLVLRNDDFIDEMIKREKKFWDIVQSGTPPQTSVEDVNALGDIITSKTGSVEVERFDLDELAKKLENAQDTRNRAEAEEKKYQATLLSSLQSVQGNNVIVHTGQHEVKVERYEHKYFDEIAFKKEHSDLYTKYTEEGNYTQVKAKKRER